MCSSSLEENLKTVISRIGCPNGLSRTSNSADRSLSSDSNCCECCREAFKEEEEEEEMKSVTEEGDDLLASSYLDRNVFGLLIPALEETLAEASKWNALRVQKCRFNGLDYIAQLLWNRNPRRSKKFSPPLDVFHIPPFKEYLRLHPRCFYPKSWLWSNDEAALYIQRYVRGWLVRKRADVQEMRQFWKNIATKGFPDKKESCIAQPQRVSGKIQNDAKPEPTDEDLLRCEKYRSMIYARKETRKFKERDTF